MIKNINKSLLKESMTYSFMFGFIAHGFMYLNADFTHDSLYGLVSIPEIDTLNISIGRFLIPLYLKIRGYVSSPLLIGIISLFFIALSTYLLIDLFKIQNISIKLLLNAIMVTNYTVTITNATYIHDADPYFVSLFFAVLAIYVFTKYDKWWTIFGITSIFLSIGLYQAYFQVSVLLVMIVVTIRLLNNEDLKKVLMDTTKIILWMVIGVVLYYGVYKLSLAISGVEASLGYNGIPELKEYLNINNLIEYINNAIKYEIAWFSGKNHHHRALVLLTNTILFAYAIWGLIFVSKEKNTRIINLIAIALVVAMMPIGMNIICVLSQGYEHEVMTYSFFIAYVLAFKIIDLYIESSKKCAIRDVLFTIALLTCSYMVFSNCVYSNEMYLEKHLVVENTLSTMTRVIDRIEQTDGYEVGKTPVVFIGTPVQSKLDTYRYGFLNTAEATNVYSAITYYETYSAYFERYLGYPINLLTIVDEYLIAEKQEVKDMSTFPDKGSVAFVGDVLVVKMCEWED